MARECSSIPLSPSARYNLKWVPSMIPEHVLDALGREHLRDQLTPVSPFAMSTSSCVHSCEPSRSSHLKCRV